MIMVMAANVIARRIIWLPIGAIINARTEQVYRPRIAIVAVSARMVIDPLHIVPAIVRVPPVMRHMPIAIAIVTCAAMAMIAVPIIVSAGIIIVSMP